MDPPSTERMKDHYILRVDCPDRPGLVAAVANTLLQAECNIEDAAQFSDKFSGRFFMRVLFRPLQGADGQKRFSALFAPVAKSFGMIWDIHPEDAKVRTLVLVSKSDHCLNDILYRARTGYLKLDIAHIVSNHENCRPLAAQAGIPYTCLPVTDAAKPAQEKQIANLVEGTGAELIVLARYMQVLSDGMCRKYQGRAINIHHSFLPGFKGAKPYHQAWERGVKIIGATAHFVTGDLDEGPIIEQQTARIDHAMTPGALQVLGQDTEAQVLSRALAFYADRRIFLHGNRTVIL
jgi:formyltetrahydrofolate deformylase